MIDQTFLIIAIIRTLLVVAVIYYVSKYFRTHKPKNKFWLKNWEKDKKLYDFSIKYYWQIGIVFFLVQMVIGLIINCW